MGVKLHLVFQGLALLVQFANMASGIVPENKKWIVAGVVGFAQAGLALKAHFENPDGTPVSVPYKQN